MSLYVFFGVIEILFLAYIRSLPTPEMTLQEVNNRFARIQIPDSQYIQREMMKRTSTSASGTAQVAEQKPSPPSQGGSGGGRKAPSAGGFLSAVASGRGGSKGSPFSDLFTTSALTGEVDKALKGGQLDKLVSNSLKNGGGGGGTGGGFGDAPSTIGIGTVARQGATGVKLGKEVSGPTVPQMTMESLSGTSDFDPKNVEETVATHAGELRDCYERALGRNPKLAGKVVVRLTLRPSGSPQLATDPKSTLNDSGLHQCILSRMASWPFVRPTKVSGPILLPFVFSPASRG